MWFNFAIIVSYNHFGVQIGRDASILLETKNFL